DLRWRRVGRLWVQGLGAAQDVYECHLAEREAGEWIAPFEAALDLWDAVTRLAAFPGFAEMKRSLRERPQLNILGGVSAAPVHEDWRGGHRV
ncbi:MAG: hypothetical protein ACO23O_04750, partial [Ilumatobacteraceae bacterium]